MAEVLRWTPLRHQMLLEVARGQRRVYFGLGRSITTHDKVFPKGAEKRTELDLMPFIGPLRGCQGTWATALLTDAGRALLARWDSEHPEVSGA